MISLTLSIAIFCCFAGACVLFSCCQHFVALGTHFFLVVLFSLLLLVVEVEVEVEVEVVGVVRPMEVVGGEVLAVVVKVVAVDCGSSFFVFVPVLGNTTLA